MVMIYDYWNDYVLFYCIQPWVFALSLLGLTPLAERVSFLTEYGIKPWLAFWILIGSYIMYYPFFYFGLVWFECWLSFLLSFVIGASNMADRLLITQVPQVCINPQINYNSVFFRVCHILSVFINTLLFTLKRTSM